MTLELRQAEDGASLLRGEMQMAGYGRKESRMYFTAARLGGPIVLTRDCTHDLADVAAAEEAAVAAHLEVKRTRRARMEALAEKYPAWGSQMDYTSKTG